jgi:hypothetical protein
MGTPGATRQAQYMQRLKEAAAGTLKTEARLKQEDARLKAKLAALTAKPTKEPAKASTVADDIWGDLPPAPQKARRAKRQVRARAVLAKAGKKTAAR